MGTVSTISVFITRTTIIDHTTLHQWQDLFIDFSLNHRYMIA